MIKLLLPILLLALAAHGQQERIAIIQTLDDRDSIGFSELAYLTDRLRETAANVLPKPRYGVMTTESIVAFLGSQENAIKICKESSCLAEIGRKVNADYVAQGHIGRFEGDLTIKVELYSSKSGVMIGSFTGSSKNMSGLLAIIDEKASILLKKLPGTSGATSSPFVASGISGLEKAADYELNGEKHYLVSLSTEPSGAVLSFDGVPSSSCAKTPCKVELHEGNVRIIASLEQYEIADTTVSIKNNNQNIAITLKSNFGVLKINPAYIDGIGNDKQWNLSINDKPYSLGEIKLSPNKYAVKLSHECYENISFEAGINKGRLEVFDMASNIVLKKGGLNLSAEADDEPISEPVYVNGKLVGETPFSEAVPICATIEIGDNREKVNVEIEHKITKTYKHQIDAEEKKQRLEAEQAKLKLERIEKQEKRFIRLGARWRGGFFQLSSRSDMDIGTKLFDKSYDYEEMEKKSKGGYNFYLNPGLTLELRIIGMIALATELSYDVFFGYDFWYGGDEDNNFIKVSISHQTIEVPVLLRFTFGKNDFLELGYQFGFPVTSEATVSSGKKFTDSPFKYKYSDFRSKTNYTLIIGFGRRFPGEVGSWGLRFTFPSTKLDRYGTIKMPAIFNLTFAFDFL